MIFSRVNKTDGKSDDEQPGGGGGTELCRGTKEVSVYMLGVFGVAMAHQQPQAGDEASTEANRFTAAS